MRFSKLSIPGAFLIEPVVFSDERGIFMETWESQKFALAGIDVSFVQDNHSSSRRGVLRGLHYQVRHPQAKLVRVVSGEVFDVAVDLRRSSPTFGSWIGVRLSSANRMMLFIPEGVAHGFLTMSDNAELVYKCSDYYDPASERTLRWDDRDVGVEWPLADEVPLILSSRDRCGTLLKEAECFP